MEKKIITIIEILVIAIAVIFYMIKVEIPEYKKNIGSSDKFVKKENIHNMYEINIDNNINFALVEDINMNLYHIFFFNENASCIYNQSLEGKNINEATKEIIKILIKENYLTTKSNITITQYDFNKENTYNNTFFKILTEYGINKVPLSYTKTLEIKCGELSIQVSDTSEKNIQNIEIYSKNITNKIKNNVDKKNKKEIMIDDTNYRTYTDSVYKKIEKYVYENNIINQESNSSNLLINLIPADEVGINYPNENSWYYVKDKKIYAYIEFSNNTDNHLGICYNGSIDNIKRGVC